MHFVTMSNREYRAAFSLGGIFSFRMLGLFMALPVFALYVQKIPGATPALMGFAIGVYGLTQALLQIPFGMLSDKFGRKPIITIGLILFIIGSIIAALATSIHGIVLGRALQGAGAIGSTLLALLAALTREEHRGKAMGIIGMTIGVCFSIALLIGPLVSMLYGLSGIFWLTALLGSIGILLLYFTVPTPTAENFHRDTEVELPQLAKMLFNAQLLRLDFGIFTLHCLLTASFVAIPNTLLQAGSTQQWPLYGIALLLAFLAMFPLIIIAETKSMLKQVLIMGIAGIGIAQLGLLFAQHSLIALTLSLGIFLTAFTILEAIIPSWITKISPPAHKGTAMGIYSTSQFLGIFIGGSLGGWLYHHLQATGVFLGCTIIAMIWLGIAQAMAKPRQLCTFMLNLGTEFDSETCCQQLLKIAGVVEAQVMADDGIAYLKLDKKRADFAALHKFSMVKTN